MEYELNDLTLVSPIFKNPLIIYKLESTETLHYSKLVVEYLLESTKVNNIYIEEDYLNNFLELDIDNNGRLLPFNEYNKSKVDICITIGGDGTVLWCNYLFGNEFKPPFLTFNMGTLGYLAFYDIKLFKAILGDLFNLDTTYTLEKRSTLVFKKTKKPQGYTKSNTNNKFEGFNYSKINSEEVALNVKNGGLNSFPNK